MKQKLFTLLTLLVLCVTGAWASTVNDLKTISTDHTVYFEDVISAGVTSGSLFANDYLFSPNGNTYKTDQGTDATINKKYCCRVKSATQDAIAFKVNGACTLVLYASRITDRTPFINDQKANKADGDNSIDGTVTATDGRKGYATYAIPAAGTYYIIGSGSDCYLAGFVVTYPGTSYTMTAAVDDETHGTASVSAASVKEGKSVTFTATENLGWKFKNWTVTGSDPVEVASTDNPYTIASVSGDVSLTANYEAVTTYNVIINAGETGAAGNYCDNKVITQNEGSMVTLPAKNSWFYKEGYTATGWTDGTNDYAFGGTFTLTGNVTIYPKFRANTKAIGDANATVTWNLTKPVSGPLHIEGTTGYFVTTADVGGEMIDVPMYWDNTSGKLDNRSRDTNNDCQVNGGSKFSIPAVKGMTVTLAASYAITATIDGNDMTATAASPFTATGTYTGTEDDVEVVINGGSWFQSITATYKVGYDAPTIVKGDFNFENKGYKVTITASEGTLNVSTDGTNYTEQTSPYETYATATTTYYAKATGADFNDSEVASLEVANSYDVSKNYVAYVYQKGYSDSSVDYDFATDELANGLAADYNVVPVELAQTDDPTAITDMDKADLIILTEAVKGSNTSTDLSNKMKEYVGTTPMIGMKVFAYTYNSDASKNRWGWGKASNHAGVNTFMPKDNTYKIFDGVVFEADGSIKLATTTSGNIIQSVDFTTPATPLSPNTIMGTVGNDDKKAVIHTTTKYLGVGISCNVRESYTPNLIAIVKNAAAILIANGDLTAKADFAKKVTGTITVSGWNSFSSVFPLDLSTITATNEVGAYYASATSGSNVTMTPTDAIVEAGEGLMIKGTAGEDFMIDVATADADFAGTNLLKGLPNGGMVTKDNNNYVFAWPTEAPANCGFYLINDVEPTLPGGKAYLHTTTALTAHELTITFEGETTGISNIDVNDNANIDANAPMYNLAGQKVTKSYKGVVIVNGKKVVRK